MVEFPGGLLVKDLALSWIKKKKKRKNHTKKPIWKPLQRMIGRKEEKVICV